MPTPDEVDASPESIAEEFHVASRNQAAYKRNFKAHDIHSAPAIRRLVTDAPLRFEDRPKVVLPHRDEPVEGSVLDAIKRRASGREYRSAPLPAGMLATMLRHANGVLASVDTPDGAFYRRAAANSGDLGSVEIYPIVFNVEGIDQGIYHFDSVSHDLTEVRRGSFADWFRELVVYQTEFAAASAALVLTSAVGRLQEKYGARGYRFGLLDVGHVSQNLYLVGAGLGLQVCATAGFIDDTVDAALGLDGLESASMLVILVGH
jgi:SagB-type dehydrogenase family enzyme